MINIIILAAGAGSRFSDYHTVPKPYVQVRGKSILEHCTSSIPFVLHGFPRQRYDVTLRFATQLDHLDLFPTGVYGRSCVLLPFDGVTRGNLETAYITAKTLHNVNSPLYIFDCDNKFDGGPVIDSLPLLQTGMPTTLAFGYDHNEPHDTSWANAKVRQDHGSKHLYVDSIREKDAEYAKYPRLVGIFGFSSVEYFLELATNIIDKNELTGNNEFYMSQTIQPGHPFIELDQYIPLGTPIDVEAFRNGDQNRLGWII